jgi:hypothetical protein
VRASTLLVSSLLLTSCATSLMKRDVQRQSDGWTLTFHELLDGPNGFTSRGAVDHVPKSGMRFLWVILSIRNDASTAREFTFDSCGLDAEGGASLPLYVGLNLGTTAEVSTTPQLAAGETITRKLAFGYPQGKLPSRLVCFGNEIDVVSSR